MQQSAIGRVCNVTRHTLLERPVQGPTSRGVRARERAARRRRSPPGRATAARPPRRCSATNESIERKRSPYARSPSACGVAYTACIAASVAAAAGKVFVGNRGGALLLFEADGTFVRVLLQCERDVRALAIAPDYPDALYWLGRLALMRAEGGPSPRAPQLRWRRRTRSGARRRRASRRGCPPSRRRSCRARRRPSGAPRACASSSAAPAESTARGTASSRRAPSPESWLDGVTSSPPCSVARSCWRP